MRSAFVSSSTLIVVNLTLYHLLSSGHRVHADAGQDVFLNSTMCRRVADPHSEGWFPPSGFTRDYLGFKLGYPRRHRHAYARGTT